MRKSTPFIYIICGLLGMLSVTAVGQTSVPIVAKNPGVEWDEMLVRGGMMRQYSDVLDPHRGWYLIMPNGLSDVITMNYVDGYSVGLHSTVGRMALDRSRWELEESAFWAFGRDALVAKAALRYLLPVEYETFFEVNGGKYLQDFDPDPAMPLSQSLMASGICGWNHYKFYEKSFAGVRLSMPLTFDLVMTGQVGWERRRAMENSTNHNLFGAQAQSNEPRVGMPHSAHDLMLYQGPIDAELVKASFRFDYKHLRSLLVMDDMTMKETLTHPTYSMQVDMGTGKNHASSESFSFLAFDFKTSHTLQLSRETDRLSYMASAGFMLRNGEIGLADMHHFNASRFWWQKPQDVSRFALLDNYELSTDGQWLEGHVEWSSRSMLLNRLVTPKEDWREFLQLHVVQVPDHRFHWEMQYGWDLLRFLRVGVSVGFDDFKYRGTAVTMTLEINAVSGKK